MSAILYPLLGGVLIGTSAILLMAFFGRVAGISGILFASVNDFGKHLDNVSSIAFVFGLMCGAAIFFYGSGTAYPTPEPSYSLAIVAGLLVGFGTKIGNGCTSGHGVCGMSRFSLRSFVSTLTFILFGMLIVGLFRHVF